MSVAVMFAPSINACMGVHTAQRKRRVISEMMTRQRTLNEL